MIATTWLLAKYWMPLGASKSLLANMIFVVLIVALILGLFYLLERYYTRILHWCLRNKWKFLSLPIIIIAFGLLGWIGFSKTLGFIPKGLDKLNVDIRTTAIWSKLDHTFPGIGKEFMPSLDEGSFLLMPTSMPHAGIQQNKEVVQQLDMLLANIPEVELAVGKLGRVESALDPAPISMYENIINYKP
ncbi:MAG: Cu(I)/Ag(I) efflux system membrane protein CusA/SilA [bacterium]